MTGAGGAGRRAVGCGGAVQAWLRARAHIHTQTYTLAFAFAFKHFYDIYTEAVRLRYARPSHALPHHPAPLSLRGPRSQPSVPRAHPSGSARRGKVSASLWLRPCPPPTYRL